MSVTIKDVAEKAGVSPATVSRVIGSRGYVSDKNRRKIQAAIRELGYQPNVLARSMVTKSTCIIGLVVTDILNPFFAHLARGVEKVTWQEGFTLILANTDEDPDRETAVVRTLQAQQVDGLILVPSTSLPSPHLSELVDRKVPLVLVDRSVRNLAVDTVMVDNEHGAYQAVSYLVQKGHSQVGVILDNPEISTNIERLAGYRRALEEAGIPYREDLIRSCQYTEQSAHDIAAEMIARADPPSAIFTTNNFMTLGALNAIIERGMKIPEQIAIVGFDDLELPWMGPAQISTVRQPVHEMGNVAAQRLLARIRGDQSPALEIRLKTRFSTE
jgi:LacI family transcriptional regulator